MRLANHPAYTITGSLSTGVELNSRAIMFTNSSTTTGATTSITAEVWITQNAGTRDTTEYGDYDGRTYKSVIFTVNVRPSETLILPIALKKVTALTFGANTTAYVLV
jgi:hypothetical protein